MEAVTMSRNIPGIAASRILIGFKANDLMDVAALDDSFGAPLHAGNGPNYLNKEQTRI
jgi:hypothetical protein